MKGRKIGPIPYNHAGGKYALADKHPVSYERAGCFITDNGVMGGFTPILNLADIMKVLKK